MAFKRIINDRRFWKSVLGLGLGFAVIYQVITMLLEYGGFHFSQFYEDKLAGNQWIRFLIGTVLAAFVYGFIVSYGRFRSQIKKQEWEEKEQNR